MNTAGTLGTRTVHYRCGASGDAPCSAITPD